MNCEDCGDYQPRRTACIHCGLLVCSHCWHHFHRCEADHERSQCQHFHAYAIHGRNYVQQLRARHANEVMK